jgi:hypothetical protein
MSAEEQFVKPREVGARRSSRCGAKLRIQKSLSRIETRQLNEENKSITAAFICGVFNDAAWSSEYVAWNGTMINE